MLLQEGVKVLLRNLAGRGYCVVRAASLALLCGVCLLAFGEKVMMRGWPSSLNAAACCIRCGRGVLSRCCTKPSASSLAGKVTGPAAAAAAAEAADAR